jgi:hypothetical protein
MPKPFAGPATRAKIKAQLGITDAVDDAELDLIAAAVNTVVRGLPVAQPASRTVTVTTAVGSPALTGAAGTFGPEDVSAVITGPTTGTNPLPAGAALQAVTSDVAATLSANATATATVTATLEAYAWSAAVDRGANMLGGRLFRRRNSPSGVETFSGDGVVYVQRSDPDIAQLLQLGDYSKPAVG